VSLARQWGFLIIEDVAYRELGFDEVPPTSLWTLGPDVVLQIGTFSKTFFPGVRLGWAVGPSPVVSKLIWAKQNTDQGAGALGQRLLESYGRRGLLDEQCGRARKLYERRCNLVIGALAEYMPDETTWTKPRGGFFTWVTVGDWADTVLLADRAREAQVAFVPGTPFFPDGRGRTNLRLSFSRVDDSDIEVGIARLATLVRDQQAATRR
jgi:2-aminoadipate transaminase